MDLFIKNASGKTFTVQIESSQPVKALQQLIADQIGMPVAQQRVIFAGQELVNTEAALSEYGLQKESTLHLYSRSGPQAEAEAEDVGPGPGPVQFKKKSNSPAGASKSKINAVKSRHGRHARRASAFDIHSHGSHGACGEGYDTALFIEDVSDTLHCGICMQVCRYPVETDCGHMFCHCCILGWRDKMEEREEDLTCPVDQEPLDLSTLRLAVRDLRLILSSKVQCPNHDKGCRKQFPLRELEEHSRDCEHRVETCTMCNEQVPARDIEEHNRVKMPVHLKYAVMENEALRSELSTVTRALMQELAAVKRQLEEVKRQHEQRIVELEKNPVGDAAAAAPAGSGASADNSGAVGGILKKQDSKRGSVRFG